MDTNREQSLRGLSSSLKVLQFSIASIVILISLLVLIGWYLQVPRLVQIVPTFAPMQYNTAICFLLSGIGLFCVSRSPKVAGIFGVALLLISLITTLQYLFNVNFGIDELAMKAFTTVKTSHPGRMAPNTGLCFILTGIITFLYGFFSHTRAVAVAGFILTLIVGVLSFVALFGYMAGLSTAYGWGTLTRMAVHTSIGFILMSIGLICCYLTLKETEYYKNSALYPMSVLIFGVFLSFLFWQALYSGQSINIQKVIDHQGNFISKVLQKTLEQNIEAVHRLFYRSNDSSYRTIENLNNDISYYFNHMDALSVLSLQYYLSTKPLFKVSRSISSDEGQSLLLQCRHAFLGKQHSNFENIDDFLCIQNKARNAIAIISLEDLIKPLLAEENLEDFNIWIVEGKNVIYQTNLSRAFDNNNNDGSFIKTITLGNLKWTLKIRPDEEFFEDATEHFPNLLFGFCLFITLILCYMIRLWQKSMSQKNVLEHFVVRQNNLEKNLNSIIETSKEAIVIANLEKTIVFCNNEASQLWGIKENAIIGDSVDHYIQYWEITQENIFSINSDYREFSNKKLITIQTGRGVEIPVEITINFIEYDAKQCVIFSLYDISDRVRFEKQITQQAETMQLIYDITSSIPGIKDNEQSFQNCLDMICQSLKWPIGHVYLRDPDQAEFMASKIWYLNDPEKLSSFQSNIQSKKIYKGQGLIGGVWALKKARWVEDIDSDDDFLDKENFRPIGLKSAIAFPILMFQEVVAIFEFFSYEVKLIDNKLLQTFEVMGQQIGRLLEREEAQNSLEIAELKNRLLLNSAGEGIYGLDLEGKATFVNNATRHILGFTEEELLHKKMHDVIHHSYQDGTPYPVESCPIYAAFTDGEEHRVDQDIFWKKNGMPINVEYVSTPMHDDTGKIIGSVVVFNDISEKLRLEKEKREQEEYYRTALESITDYAIVSLDRKGNVTSWNIGAEKIKGYQKEEILNKHFSIFYPQEDSEYLPKQLLEKAAENGSVQHTGWRVKKDGTLFWADVVINALYDDNHKIRGYIKITRDITDRKKVEDELKSYSDELEKSNQELDSFAYIASHDLREPLRGITNMSSFLLEDYTDKLDDTGKDYLNRLAKLCSRLENFIDALLQYSRVGRLDLAFKKVCLNTIVSEKIDLIAQFIQDHHAEVKIEVPLPTIVCDQSRIGEVFLNLITNGIKYNDSKNKIIEISFEENTENYIFCVQDNGIGIEEKNYQKIFRIFTRLHGKEKYGGGTGAGMTIVKKIIEKHHGKVWIDSEVGKGSKFYFSISKKLLENNSKEKENER